MKYVIATALLLIFSIKSSNDFVVKKPSTALTIPGLKEDCFHQALRTLEGAAQLTESIGNMEQFLLQENKQLLDGDRITQRELKQLHDSMQELEHDLLCAKNKINAFKKNILDQKTKIKNKIKRS